MRARFVTVSAFLKPVYLSCLIMMLAGKSFGQSLSLSTTPNPLVYGSNLTASATANAGFLGTVNSVTFTFNGVTVVDNTSPYATTFSTSTLAPGNYALSGIMNYTPFLGAATNYPTVSQTVTIYPATPAATATSTCAGNTASISVSGGLPAGGTYSLYSAPTGGTAVATTTGSTLVTPAINATTTYYVAYTANGIESSSRTAVTVTANSAPSAPVITAPAAVNIGNTATISVPTQTGVTFSWTTNGGTPASSTGNSISVSWATSGAKTVTVTATNTTTGCTATSSKVVTVTNNAATSYAFKKVLTLNTTSAGITTNQTNFPALVYIKDDALIIKNQCNDRVIYPNGNYNGSAGTNYDFAFTDASANELAYQVETYDQTTGTLLVWVRIPTLTAATNNSINFYFGSLTPQHSATFYSETWVGDYLAVYHFNEAAGSTVLDATNNDVDGTPTSLTATTDRIRGLAGLTGGAYTFNGTSSKIIANKTANITGSFTLSAWVNVSNPAGDNKIVSNELDYGPGYKLAVKTSAIEVETRSTNTIGQVGNLGRGGTVTTGWHYVQGTFNGTTFRDFYDGAAVSTTTTNVAASNIPLAGSLLTMGIDRRSSGNDENFYNGSMDEVRISNVVKSDDWIKVEYYNQTNPTTFTNYSAGITTNSTVAATIPGALTYTYKGVTSTYTDATNWDNTTTGATNEAPVFTGSATIIIPTGKTLNLTSNAAINGLTINGTGAVNLNGNTLSVACNIYNNNTTTGGILYNSNQASGITWNGTIATQTYTGSSTAIPAQVGNMTISNTGSSGQVRITGGAVNMYNVLTLTSGSLLIDNAGSGSLTLKSTSALNYAQIAPIPTGLTIQGNINDEVLYQGGPGYRNYRSIAAPVYNNTTTYSATNGSYLLNGLKSAFIITGANGTANGFDASTNNGATLRIYNSSTNRYIFVTNLNTATYVSSGNGFFLYYRGTRTPTGTVTAADPFGSKTNKANGGGSYAIAESQVFTYTGVANQGSISPVTIPASSTSYYHIANPYAATFDAGALLNSTSAVLQNTWTWSPTNGAYAVYDNDVPAASTNGAKRYVVPGQSFFVKANNTTGSAQTLTITESMKSVGSMANAVRFLSTSIPNEKVELPVMRLQFAKNKDVFDEVAVVLKPGSKDSIDALDAEQLGGDNIAFTTITPDKKYLSIDKRPFDEQSRKVIPLYISTATDTIYTFKHTYLSGLMSNYKVTLYDSLLNNNVDIAHNDYAVNIYKNQPATWGGKRFTLIIEQKQAPVTFFDFKGKLTAEQKALLTWRTSEHRFGTTYQLQRSQDNKTFVNIGKKQVASTDSTKDVFNQEDADMQTGTNYYRLVQTDVFNNQHFSDTVALEVNSKKLTPKIPVNGFKLYPNPVADHFSIISDKTYTGKIIMRIYDSGSRLKYTSTFTQLSTYTPIEQYVSDLKLGVYIVELRDANNKEITTLKFLKH